MAIKTKDSKEDLKEKKLGMDIIDNMGYQAQKEKNMEMAGSVVDLSKSLPADNNPASILLALNTGVPVNFKSNSFPASKILSPIDGNIVNIDAQVGALTSKGKILASILNTQFKEIETDLRSDIASEVKIGSIVDIFSQKAKLSGKVRGIVTVSYTHLTLPTKRIV